jgi:hypothetical protein
VLPIVATVAAVILVGTAVVRFRPRPRSHHGAGEE